MSPLISHEWSRLPWRVVYAALALGLGLLGASHLIIPALPALPIEFLETAFAVSGLRAVLVLNDHLATWTIVFALGVGLLHEGVVAPRETRELGLWLSKPIERSTFLWLRALPALAASGGVGLVLSLATALSVAGLPAGGTTTPGGALLEGLVLTLGGLVVLAAVLGLQVASTDGFQALMLAFVAWILPLLPASVLIYRPDVLAQHPTFTAWGVFPANLIWADLGLLPLLPPALGLSAALGALLFRLAVWRFERAEGA